MHVRVCRDCGEEYRPEIAICADCGGELVSQWEDENGVTSPAGFPAAPPEPAGPDLTGFRPVFVTGQAAALVPLAERLRGAGITFHLHESVKDPRAPAASFSLLVQDADAAQVLRELAPLLADGEEPEAMHTVESDFADGAYRRCPACGAELSAAAKECPECELGLGGARESCARCGQPLGPGDVDCPACRAADG
jgi:uncharacterized protein with PIN domain